MRIRHCGTAAAPDRTKLGTVLLALIDLLGTRRASPHAVSSILGTLQWFCVLSRAHFSLFDRVFTFVRREPFDDVIDVPLSVLRELLSFAFLSPLLEADLSCQWDERIIASDAAPDFGFGVSFARASPDVVADLGRKAERRGDYITMDGSDDPLRTAGRLGTPHHLFFDQADFTDVISHRCHAIEHSSILELRGVLLMIKWALRRSSAFGRRLLMLVDVKAAFCALAQGR